MECPECSGLTRVYITRQHSTLVLRYRKCTACGHKFKAWEEGDKSPIRPYAKQKPAPHPDLFEALETSHV